MAIQLQEGTSIQTLILSKDRFNIESARSWINENNFRDDKIDETENSFRFRQADPSSFDENGFGSGEKFRTIDITEGVKAVIGFIKQNQLQESGGHVHSVGDGQTSPAIEVEGGHWHEFNEEFTSVTQDTLDHTHTLPDGTITGPPINEQIESQSESLSSDDKMKNNDRRFNFCYSFDEVKLSENDEKKELWIEYMHTISGAKHARYGEINISKQDLLEYKRNFDEGVRGGELPVDYYHESLKMAAGWIKKLDIRNDGNELWALVEFTPRASTMLADKELRFFSPDYAEKHITKAGQVIKNVLLGGGLTNRPFLDLSPITLSEHLTVELNEDFKMEEIQMADVKKLSEKVITLNETIEELAKKLDESEVKSKELSEKMETLQKEKDDQAFSIEFSRLLSEGKVLPAHKEQLQKKFCAVELAEFYSKMPAIINLSEIGVNNNTESTKLSQAEKSLVDAGLETLN
jgi:phage I-like protein